jgi:hypothetical protein
MTSYIFPSDLDATEKSRGFSILTKNGEKLDDGEVKSPGPVN